MVTQDAAILPKVNKMKVKKMKKKAKKKKIKGADNFDSESEADKLDLEQKMYPLSHYISDQEELVNQMFLTLSGSKLEAMLPPVLKSTPLTELKRLCIHELRGMSKKRILCCISGEVMEGSSGSEDEEDDKGEAAGEDSTQNNANTKGEKRLGDDQAPESYLLKKIKVEPGLEDSTGSGEGKSVLELLELEMRARIIKTMLEKGDEGKKITEDAIAAVMQSAKQITKEGDAAAGVGSSKEATNPVQPKDDSQRSSGREAVSEEESVEERSRGRRRTHGREGDRRRRHRPPGDGKRTSSRSRKRGSGSYSDEDSHGRSSKKPKEPNSSEKHAAKKKKITRKEFEERMKRAKKNRTYRQRKSSEDDDKTNENEDKPDDEKPKGDSEENTDNKPDSKTREGKDGTSDGNLTQDGAEREASEKEEGEIDSNEEEEGACSPSDMSSGSHYSSSSTYSRSRSRSYSRSLSRSPKRGRQKRSSRRSRSRSRKRRRSYSRSFSRSRSPEKRKGRGEHQKRGYGRKRSPEPRKPSSGKREVKKASPAEDRSPSREEDWGHKCDIEFVDSEEDFDDNPETTKKDTPAKKTVPVNRIERASISFSLQKKPVGIAQGIDLDDLPLKKKPVDDIEAIAPAAPVKKPPASEEIVISSDSEAEVKDSTKGITGQKQKSKEQAEKTPVTSITSSSLDRTKTTDVNPQIDQGKLTKKTTDPETKPEPATKGIQGDYVADSSKLAVNTTCEIPASKGVEKTDKAISKEESHARDSKESRESVNTLESSPEDTEDARKDGEREHRGISPGGKLEDKPESLRTDPLSDGSIDSKGKSSDGLCEEREQDTVEDAMDTHMARVDPVRSDEVNLSETEVTKISFKKSRKRKTDRVVNLKPTIALHSLEEGEQTEALTSSSTDTRSQKCEDKGVESIDKDMALDSDEEKVEKSDVLETSAQKEEEKEADDKDVTTVHGDQNDDIPKATKKPKESEDDKEVEERVFRELRRRRRAPVDPIRIETGLIRRRVQPSRKIEMIVPEKSWMKREKKKKDKTMDVLAMEGVGLLKSTLSEASQGSPKDTDQGMETTHSIEPVEMSEDVEPPGKALSSPTQLSDTENSQPLQRPLSPSPKPDTSPETSQSEDRTTRKVDQDTEIIGVIETSKDASDNFDDMELGGASWSMRWLQSEKVQKVVTSSKMLSRVRKKIQKKEKATKGVVAEKVEEPQKPSEAAVPVIGSIEEYERLFGTRVKKDEAAGAGAGVGAQDTLGQGQMPGISAQTQGDIPEVKDKGNPVFGSDDDGEDSEEEALWSKIIKK